MAITYYMLQIPPVLFFLLISGLGGILGGVATILTRKYLKIRILKSHNEVTGFLFLAIAGFYGLLLSFVVFVVFSQFNAAHSNVSREGSLALGLYRDIKYYPDTTESKPLLVAYLDFVYDVVDEEFPNMEKMMPSHRAPESFNRVFYTMEHLNPKTPFQIQLVSQMFNHLNELSSYRGLRIASIETEIPPPIWLPMIFGGIITIICSLLMDIEHKRMHVGLNTLLGCFVGMLFFTIILLDHPYTGSLAIKPKSYKQIFTIEQWEHDSRTKK